MKKFYTEILKNNDIINEAFSFLNSKESKYTLYQKRFGVQDFLIDLGLNSEIFYDKVLFGLEDDKFSFSFSYYFNDNNYFKINLIDKKNLKNILFKSGVAAQYSFFIYYKNFDCFYNIDNYAVRFLHQNKIVDYSKDGIEQQLMKRNLFDFIVENISFDKEQILEMCVLNFDLDLKNEFPINTLITEMLYLKNSIKTSIN